MPATARPAAVWNLLSEHSGAFLRLQRMLEGRRSFTLCFLMYSDSAYRDRVADFLAERLCARVRVTIDPDAAIGTEALFEKLSADRRDRPAQLIGLERWPEGLDDLLARLNYRRGALAERCTRPLLVWVLSRHLRSVATRAADLWAWRSGVFDFTLPADNDSGIRLLSPYARETAAPPRRLAQIAELQKHLAGRSQWRAVDVDLALELGDLRVSLGNVEEAEAAYRKARAALSSLDDHRLIAIAEGRIADILETRGELDEALRIRTEKELPVFERLGDVRARAITQGQIADILQVRGELDEALRIRTEEELPVYERLGDVRARAIASSKIADILAALGKLSEALRVYEVDVLPALRIINNQKEVDWARARMESLRATQARSAGRGLTRE